MNQYTSSRPAHRFQLESKINLWIKKTTVEPLL